MATAQNANDLTRQQLDELDALLQRMLSLPLNPPEAAANPTTNASASRATAPVLPLPELPAAAHRSSSTQAYAAANSSPLASTSNRDGWRADSPSSPMAGPQLLAMPASYDAAPAATVRNLATPQPFAVESESLPIAQAIEEDFAAPSMLPKAANNPAPAQQQTSLPVRPTVARAEAVPALLAPLVGFNSALNAGLGQLGLPGRILQSGFAKNLLGFVGLGLLLYTSAKICQMQGLISAPIALPWPT